MQLVDCTVDGEFDVANTNCSSFRAQYLKASSAHRIGPIKSAQGCSFLHVQFNARIRLEIDAKRLDLTGTQFLDGGEMVVSRAAIDLRQVSSGKSLHISGNVADVDRPWVQSLQNADVGSMSFAHLSINRCMFYGSRNLRNTIIEPTVKLDTAPGFYKRRCVADEVAWRSNAGGVFSRSWKALADAIQAGNSGKDRYNDLCVQLAPIRASQVAGVYRGGICTTVR